MKDVIYGSSFKRWLFFIVGIVATISYRIIVFLEGSAVKIMWYIGTIGFVFYFWHRARVQKRRVKIVRDLDLVNFVEGVEGDGDKKRALRYLVVANGKSKARWNSLVIFWLSFLALVFSILVDFLK